MGLTSFYGAPLNLDDAIKVIHRAIQLGVNFFDTAHIYGWGHNELFLGAAIRSAIASGLIKRENVVIATKYGIYQNADGTRTTSSSPAGIKQVVDQSLAALGLDYIDLLYQHRVDPNTPIEESIKAAAEYVKAGKVKYLGLSEAAPETIRRAHAVHPITALQTEYSLWSTDPETDGTFAVCRELGITFVAYSPLGRGFLTGSIKSPNDFAADDFRRANPRFMGENFNKNLELVEKLKKIAEAKKVTPGQLALAWVNQQPGVVSIPGTTKIPNLEENVAAFKVHLSDDETKEIRKLLNEFTVVGDRYPAAMMKAVSL